MVGIIIGLEDRAPSCAPQAAWGGIFLQHKELGNRRPFRGFGRWDSHTCLLRMSSAFYSSLHRTCSYIQDCMDGNCPYLVKWSKEDLSWKSGDVLCIRTCQQGFTAGLGVTYGLVWFNCGSINLLGKKDKVNKVGSQWTRGHPPFLNLMFLFPFH